jgi:hypothetical protein
MSDSANITSLDAVRQFMSAVIQFQSEARTSLAAFETQLNRIMFWLGRERPEFWKREIEKCMREAADARVRLHQCRMRRVGDFRPSCIEEVKDLEAARRRTHFAQKQIPVVKRWRVAASHEANEFHGRSAQLVQILEREIPRLLALLQKSVERIESYAAMHGVQSSPRVSEVTQLASEMEAQLKNSGAEEASPDVTTAGGAKGTVHDTEKRIDPQGPEQSREDTA